MSEVMIQQDNGIIAKAEIDTMITTAKAYPRTVSKCIEEAVALATINEEVAASCIFALPRKDKDGNKVEVKGESIRLAEIMLACWGNMHAATRIVEVGEKHITTEGVCWDLEKNNKVSQQDKISIWFGEKGGKGGYRANNDMQIMLSKASSAKSFRNAVFKVIPKTFVQMVYQECVKKAVGDTKTLNSKITNVVGKLVKMGLNKEEMMEFFGHKTLNDFTADDYASLIGIGTALKDGMVKPEEVFAMEKDNNESASHKLNDLLASKKTPQLDSSVNAQTGEILNDLPY